MPRRCPPLPKFLHSAPASPLTPAPTRRSVRSMLLFRRTAGPLSHAFVALVASFCLLVAPLCASLCSANACAGTPGMPSCHEMNHSFGSESSLAATTTCARADLSAMLLKSDESSFSCAHAKSAAIHPATAGAALSFFAHGSLLRFGASAPYEHAGSSPGFSILRI